MTPRTTVICAVWHQDPDRHELLRSHRENLRRQTVPVDVVYVFDNGDTPPDGLDATVVVAPDPLTIYQAWSVAADLVETDYVMNLNLDDRLNYDAVAILQAFADGNDAALVGGEWRITYSQEATDEMGPVSSALPLPFRSEWPPEPGSLTRLGSGTGERGTFGPATMWRADLHRELPYPWQFGDGSLIESIGDMAWWVTVRDRFLAPVLRLPFLIGNYHSHPETQAEFRLPDELDRLSRLGVGTYRVPTDGLEVTRWN